MNVFYEEGGGFKVGTVLTDNTTSMHVESVHGKRSKIKAANVLLRFSQPGLSEFLTQAEAVADGMDVEFLWECSPQTEFGFETLATEYFGHAPSPAEAAGALICLHSAPMYFYKKGKGHYKAAPPEALKAALAGAEKKRLLAQQQAQLTEQLSAFSLPDELKDIIPQLLYKPDRNTVEVKALEAACAATHLSPAHLLDRCGAIPSSHEYHLQRFLFEHFPRGTGFPEVSVDMHPELPLAEARAFSIDDAATTEIDDAFSVMPLPDGNWRVGVHIAAPALTIAPGSPVDEIAAQRLSTVYMPGSKITMLPDNVVQSFTLNEDTTCPAVSLYLDVDGQTLAVSGTNSRIERIHIANNLRHDTLEPLFNEQTLADGKRDYPYAEELALLWNLAGKLEALRGKSGDSGVQQMDYNFEVEGDHVTITERRRGSPIDKVVSEMMIFANSEWGKLLANHNATGIYRTQSGGKVKMSTVPGPHQGLGVAQYLWSSSPLRRYVDLINQRQIVSVLQGEIPPYAPSDHAIFVAMRDFDTAYAAYNEFQRGMERYWCLRWLLQENVKETEAVVQRENLVKLAHIPLYGRIPSLPELPPNTRVMLEIGDIDLLDRDFKARYITTVEATV